LGFPVPPSGQVGHGQAPKVLNLQAMSLYIGGRHEGTLCQEGLSETAHRRTLQPQSLAIAGVAMAPRTERQQLILTRLGFIISNPINCQKEQGLKINDKIPTVAVL
jgi:hypothetical protein